jgi:hypothetical protein
MYKSRFSKWGFGKNHKRGQTSNQPKPSSGRTRAKKRAAVTCITPSIVPIERQRLVFRLPNATLQSSHTFHGQEITIYAVDAFTTGLFESQGWSYDPFAFHSSLGKPDHTTQWADLDDRFFGASVLIEQSSMAEGFTTLDSIFQQIRSLVATSEPGPAIMVRLWPICHRIDGICACVGDYTLMYMFLRYLRDLIGNYFPHGHPLYLLLDAVSRVEKEAVIPTLRLGYFKAIRCLERLVGTDHATVLKMWSNYVKYWDRQSIDQQVFAANFTRLLEAAEAKFGRCAEETVRILHSFSYAVFYNSADKPLARSLAHDLVERTTSLLCEDGEMQWGIEAQGFAFGSKVLALLSLDAGDRDGASATLVQAVERLKTGDRECRTRAIMLLEDLERCLVEWGRTEALEEHKFQRIALLGAL